MLAGGSVKTCDTKLVELSRIEYEVTNIEVALRVISFVLQALALIYIRNRIIKLEEYYDERTTSLSDFSIIIKGITKMKGIQGKIK